MLRVFVVALALVMAGYNIGRSLMGPKQGNDFAPHYVASHALLDGRPELLYSTGEDYQDYTDRIGVRRSLGPSGNPIRHLPNAYPPVAVVLLAPLALLPYTVARITWYALSLGAMAGVVWLLFHNRPREQRRELLIAGAVMTAILFPVYSSLYMGQINSLLLLLLVASLHMARRNRDWAAGALVGLAGLIKIFPFVVVVWFLSTRRYRAAMATVVASAAMAAASLLVVDWRVQTEFLFRTLPAQSFQLHIEKSQGFFGLFTRLLGSGELVTPIAYMPGLARGLAALCGIGCLLMSALATWRHPRHDRLSGEISFALFLVVAVLASPKSWDHYAVYLLPAYLLFFEAVTQRLLARAQGLTLVVAITFCIWMSVMTTSAEIAQLPTGVMFQPLWSIKCLSMLALWVCLIVTLKGLKDFEPQPALARVSVPLHVPG